MIDLGPGSEAHRLIRAGTTLLAGIYPLGTNGPGEYEQAVLQARCIETARALVATLRLFDLPAKLMPVDILVSNPKAFELQRRGIPVSQWPDEAWSVGIVDDPNAVAQNDRRTGGWDGHMLVRVAKAWMCDPNSGQFRRPGRIAMPGSWTIEYPKDQWDADRNGWAIQGVVTEDAPGPKHPHFPFIQVRQRPDNNKWQQGTAARNDITPVVNLAAHFLGKLQRGELEDVIKVIASTGDEVDLDVSQVVARYHGGAA